MSVFELQGTAAQNSIIEGALARCDFPFDRLGPELLAEVGRSSIPVDWQDLSRYTSMLDGEGHLHVHEDGDVGHPVVREVAGRARVLGLAWYSGRVTIDSSLTVSPALAMEVFLAEGAHMVDFFYLHNDHRLAIVNALHHDQLPDETSVADGVSLPLDGHVCSWFDIGGYDMWVGEAFMEAFIEAFSDVRVTISLGHPVSPVQAAYIRRVVLGPPLQGTANGRAYHRPTCPFIRPFWVMVHDDWMAPVDAQRAGRRPCRVCRPE